MPFVMVFQFVRLNCARNSNVFVRACSLGFSFFFVVKRGRLEHARRAFQIFVGEEEALVKSGEPKSLRFYFFRRYGCSKRVRKKRQGPC